MHAINKNWIFQHLAMRKLCEMITHPGLASTLTSTSARRAPSREPRYRLRFPQLYLKKCNNYETNKKTFISLGWPVSSGKVKNRTSKSPGINYAVLSNVASGSGRNCIILSDLGSTLLNKECMKKVCHLNFFLKILSK